MKLIGIFGQSMPEVHEADFAHHRVPRLVPELARHVAVVAPRLALRLGDDAGHHLRHVDLAQPLVEHHQRLVARRELLVVEERLGVDAHVVGVVEALVALGDAVVLDRAAWRSAVLAG